MDRTVVAGFGSFLDYNINSSEKFLNSIPASSSLIKVVLPVGYYRRDILRLARKYSPKRIIILGMHSDRKEPQFEVKAKNLKKILRNPIFRVLVYTYSRFLKVVGKNLRVKKQFPPEKLKVIPVRKKGKNLTLHTKPPQRDTMGISEDAGTYVCNYAMWTLEHYIQVKKLDIDFYFIHLPQKLNSRQEKELLSFIFQG